MRTVKRKLVVGILAHVDAGKTTLSEAFLYAAGKLRKRGRVDHGDAFLDTDEVERERGITIYSKEARFEIGDTEIILADTPGHVDFSAETERVLQVLDCAVLIVSATDGVQAHTRTLAKLLDKYGVPTFIFVNKTDLPFAGEAAVAEDIRKNLGDATAPFFTGESDETRAERLALFSEKLLEKFTSDGTTDTGELTRLTAQRKLIPVFFGSARTTDGVEEFLNALVTLAPRPEYPTDVFGARVFKIAHDGNVRLTYMKITGGTLNVRDAVKYDGREEKAAQIRLYSGNNFTQTDNAYAGDICAVIGLTATYAGQGLGAEEDGETPLLEPVLTYKVILPNDCPPRLFYPKLLELSEEDPSLRPVWSEELQELQVRLMGEVQTEILTRKIKDRFGVDVAFGEGRILYKETIAAPVEGVGHFEPLKHYAEVHLLLEPLPRGTGLVTDTVCPTDELASNWQNLVDTVLNETQLRGVLVGAPLTDIKITLLTGRSHPKHTEGGDFREATLRALRQGLMSTRSVLLEPFYAYRLSVPSSSAGRAIHDLQMRHAEFVQETDDNGFAVFTGRAPVAKLSGYAKEVAAYSGGNGSFSCVYDGDGECENAEEVIAESGYKPEADMQLPPHSVFCAHGAGFVVPWNKVREYMDLPAAYRPTVPLPSPRSVARAHRLSDAQLEEIMNRTYGPIKRRSYAEKRIFTAERKFEPRPETTKLIVDGYNVIFAWDFLAELAQRDLDHARDKLIDILKNYAAYTKTEVTAVFDGYRVPSNAGSEATDDGVTVIYTPQGQTADACMEKLMHGLGPDHTLRVVTSDKLVQFAAIHSGVFRLSAREFLEEIKRIDAEITAFIKKLEKENR